jgi:hypothetical protein
MHAAAAEMGILYQFAEGFDTVRPSDAAVVPTMQ